jgi:CheY-like chemotaxis protein
MQLRILIVDDNPSVRTVIRECLQSVRGWQVCSEARNGREAVQMAKEVQPNLIILDLSMSVMNGLEAARILKKLMPAVPLIMFTSFITQRLKQEALSAGISRVMAKEGPRADLVNALRALAEAVA